MRKSLTKRQNDIFDFIKDKIEANNIPPTIIEICNNFGIKSTNAVYEVLKVLEKKEYIFRKDKGASRGISINEEKSKELKVEQQNSTPVNIIGKGNVINPISIFLSSKGIINLDTQYFKLNVGNHFAHIVEDNGMSKDGIFKGDLVLVAQGKAVESGNLVVALVNDNLFVRTIERYSDGDELIAGTRGFPKIKIIKQEKKVMILGVVSGLIKRF